MGMSMVWLGHVICHAHHKREQKHMEQHALLKAEIRKLERDR